MENKHTLTKWSVNKIKSHPWIVECETNVPCFPGEVAIVSFKPYARLIASAPDLLEACKEALRYIIELQVVNIIQKSSDRTKSLEQAIAKAEGK